MGKLSAPPSPVYTDAAAANSRALREEAAAAEAARQERITQGRSLITQALAPYDDTYFKDMEQRYIANAVPSLNDRFTSARDELTKSLSRSGLMSSSVAAEQMRKLTEQRAQYEREVASGAVDFANQGRSSLENTRTNLYSQLAATEDPTAAEQTARIAANTFGRNIAMPTVGDFVFDAGNNFANMSYYATNGQGYFNKGPTANYKSAAGSGSSRIVS
jgi:hypothetical protein